MYYCTILQLYSILLTNILLYNYTILIWHYFTIILLCYYSIILLYHYPIRILCCNAIVRLYYYTIIQLCYYTFILLHHYIILTPKDRDSESNQLKPHLGWLIPHLLLTKLIPIMLNTSYCWVPVCNFIPY